MKQKLTELKRKIDSSTIIFGSFIPFSVMDRQKIYKEIVLNNIINQLNLTDIYLTLPKAVKYSLLMCMWNILQNIPCIKT